MAPIKTNPYLIIVIRSLYVVATSNAMRLPDTNNQPTLSGRVGHSSISTPAIIIIESAAVQQYYHHQKIILILMYVSSYR